MANNDEDKTIREVQLSGQILEGARDAAKTMGVSPGAWILALTEELGEVTLLQRHNNKDLKEGLRIIVEILEDVYSLEEQVNRAIAKGAKKQ